MPLTVQCPSCQRVCALDQEVHGGWVRCPHCGHAFTFEIAADGTVASPAASGPLPSRPSGEAGKVGRYVLRTLLGGGSMGDVWLAYDPDLERDVAVKTLRREHARNADHRERFLREARGAAKLHHTNAVTIYEVGSEGDTAFIAMEFVDGDSLEHAVEGGAAMDWPEATRAIRDAAAGLGAAHEIGLVHRDIKPANLLRTRKGVTKIADFGLVRAQMGDSRLTRPGVFLGTPAYLAPERWRGEDADARTDLYALVCTYFQLLTGRVPYDAPGLPALGRQHLQDRIPDPRRWAPDVPEAVCRILERGMAKERDDRYPAATDLIADLDRLLAAAPPEVVRTPAPASPPVPSRAPEPLPARGRLETGRDGGMQTQRTPPPHAPVVLPAPAPAPQSAPVPAPEPLPPPPPRAKRTQPIASAMKSTWQGSHAAGRSPWALRVVLLVLLGAIVAMVAAVVLMPTAAQGKVKIQIQGDDGPVELKRVRVAVDGRAIDPSRLSAPISLGAGDHQIVVESPGHETARQAFKVGRGKQQIVRVRLAAQSRRAAP